MNKRQTYMDALREIAEKRPEVLSSHQITMLVHTALYADRLHEVSRLRAILIERAGKPPVLLPSKGEWNIYSVGDDELYDRISIR